MENENKEIHKTVFIPVISIFTCDVCIKIQNYEGFYKKNNMN